MHSTKAVVLNNRPYGEYDELVSFFTENFGKMKIKARSSKKITTKQGNFLHNFSVIKLSFVVGRAGNILSGVETEKTYPAIAGNLYAAGYVNSFFRLCDKVFYEGERDDASYRLFTQVLETADKIARQGENIQYFLWKNEKQWLSRLLQLNGLQKREFDFSGIKNPKQLDIYYKKMLQNQFEMRVDFFGQYAYKK